MINACVLHVSCTCKPVDAVSEAMLQLHQTQVPGYLSTVKWRREDCLIWEFLDLRTSNKLNNIDIRFLVNL